MRFILLVGACVAIYFGFKNSLLVGLIVSAVVLIYLLIKLIPFSYRYKSRKALANGDFSDAKLYYQKAMKYLSNNYDSKMEYTYMLLRAGEFEEAQQVMDSLLSYRLEPQKRNVAIIQRAICYYKNGNLEEAYKDMCELYEDGFRSIMMYGLLGYFKILIDPMSDDTYNFCAEAYDYADDDRDIGDNMLICHYNRGEYDKAKKISDSILEAEPKFVEAWYHAAQIDTAMGDYKAAREKLDKISECHRSSMTTIPEESVAELSNTVNAKLKEIN